MASLIEGGMTSTASTALSLLSSSSSLVDCWFGGVCVSPALLFGRKAVGPQSIDDDTAPIDIQRQIEFGLHVRHLSAEERVMGAIAVFIILTLLIQLLRCTWRTASSLCRKPTQHDQPHPTKSPSLPLSLSHQPSLQRHQVAGGPKLAELSRRLAEAQDQLEATRSQLQQTQQELRTLRTEKKQQQPTQSGQSDVTAKVDVNGDAALAQLREENEQLRAHVAELEAALSESQESLHIDTDASASPSSSSASYTTTPSKSSSSSSSIRSNPRSARSQFLLASPQAAGRDGPDSELSPILEQRFRMTSLSSPMHMQSDPARNKQQQHMSGGMIAEEDEIRTVKKLIAQMERMSSQAQAQSVEGRSSNKTKNESLSSPRMAPLSPASPSSTDPQTPISSSESAAVRRLLHLFKQQLDAQQQQQQ